MIIRRVDAEKAALMLDRKLVASYKQETKQLKQNLHELDGYDTH
jgi:hypothetical protein